MVDRRAEFDLFGSARHRREHHEWIGAVRFAFPERAETDLLRQLDQARHIGRGIMRGRIDLNVKNHITSPSTWLNLEDENLNEP
jgi:hypothetical protein